jgi:hypothetical protein
MSPLQRRQRSVLWILDQLRAEASIDCCCVSASAVPIDTSFSDPPVYLTPFHNEVQWQLAFQKSSHMAWIIDVPETTGDRATSFGNLCRENNEVPRTICRSDGTVPKGRHWLRTFMEAG